MIVRRSRLRQFVLFLMTAAVAYLCRLLSEAGFIEGKMWLANWMFTILAVLVLGIAIFGRRVVAEVSPHGLFAPGICHNLIPWTDIQSMSVASMHAGESVKVAFVPGSRSESAVAAMSILVAGLGASQGRPGHEIPLGSTGVSGAAFLAAVQEAKRACATPGARGFGHRMPRRVVSRA